MTHPSREMTLSKKLRGVIAAIVTPIDAHGEPDFDRFARVAKHLLDNGCDGLNVLGTTGEATSFSLRQRTDLMRKIAASPLPVARMMVGTGAAAVEDAAALSLLAGQLGFAGALLLPPFYYKGVPESGIVRYFDRIADATKASDVPLYLYHFPAQSGVPYTLALIEKLIKTFGARIAGLKDSSGDMPYARSVVALSKSLDVFPSNEACLLDARKGDFAGCISATANTNAPYCGRAFRDGDETAHKTAVAIRKLFDGKPLVPGVKALTAHILGDDAIANLLPPFDALSATDRDAVIDGYRKLTA